MSDACGPATPFHVRASSPIRFVTARYTLRLVFEALSIEETNERMMPMEVFEVGQTVPWEQQDRDRYLICAMITMRAVKSEQSAA